MEFRDLKAQYAALKEEIDAAMLGVAASSTYIGGKPVQELERALADYIGVKYCLTCANGTDALLLALMAWDIGPGDAVFIPSFTFFASAEVVSLRGATPVFVDVDPDTFNLDAVRLEERIAEVLHDGKLRPRVVMPVDLFGLAADYPRIRQVAEKHGLLILEDGAQGFGGSLGDRKACSFGDISTTSFFPAKPLGCYGDGGAVFTDNERAAQLIGSLKVHGKGESKYDNVRIGLNSRLDTIQAAVLLPKLRALQSYELARVNEAAADYTAHLSGLVKTPATPDGYYSSWAQYTITLESREQRDGLQAHLKKQGIPSMIYYQKPMHLQTAYASLGYSIGDFPVTERLCDCVLSLPIHPYLTKEALERVAEHVKVYLNA